MLEKKKTMSIIIALILISTIAIPLANLSVAYAHTPPWTVISYAYIVVAPNPIGVGQTVAVNMLVDYPLPDTLLANDIRRINYDLTITKPDGSIETKHWDVVSDPTGVQYYRYTPDQVGTYVFKFDYGGQTYNWNASTTQRTYNGDIFLSASRTTNLTVQQEPIPNPINSYPLPTEYWTYPIEGQNTDWYTISSNWLSSPYIIGAPPGTHGPGGIQPYGSAPNSAHIMWTKPIQYGGVVGGNAFENPGVMYYQGGSYNSRFMNPIIMQGTLFYQEPYGNSGSGGPYIAVDLRTGQELWRKNTTETGINLVPSFGYLYDFESPNQHGVLPNGLLIASASVSGQGTVWRGYDPRTGVLTSMNITNVPGGVNVAGPKGEYLKYELTNLGTSSNPKWYLTQWNSSKVFGAVAGTGVGAWYSGTANASLPSAYDWNISVTLPPGTGWTIGTGNNGLVRLVDVDDMILLRQGTFGAHVGMVATITASVSLDPANVTAINLKSNSRGQVLWSKTYQPAPANVTRTILDWDPKNGVFVFEDKETMVHYGYSLANGEKLWGPTALTNDYTTDWNYFSLDNGAVAYGKLYFWGGFSGILYAYDIKTGELLWTYGNGGEGNSTASGLYTPYGAFPIFSSAIADGKIFLTSTEHSPNSPLFKGARLIAVNATDGKEIWSALNWGLNMYGGNTPIADGYLISLNTYDTQIYSFGKGPSATTVNAPEVGVPFGASLTIRGTVMDIAAGTKQPEQAARFPNGVAAVSEDSMEAWMEYVYMQKPRPMDTIGVEVTISVVDSNGNYREIGKATSNADGFYSLQWKPDIPGKYTVFASFSGSESYWPSHDVTAFSADTAPETTAAPTPVTQSAVDLYFVPAVVAIILAIAVVGIVLALLLIRKRP